VSNDYRPTRLSIQAPLSVDVLATRDRRGPKSLWGSATGRSSGCWRKDSPRRKALRSRAIRSTGCASARGGTTRTGPQGWKSATTGTLGPKALIYPAARRTGRYPRPAPAGRWRVDGAHRGGLDGGKAGPSRAPAARAGGAAARRLDRQSATPVPGKRGSGGAGRLSKTLPAVVQAVQQPDPQDGVELWTTDQHRMGLKPVRRRVWSPRGQRPQAVVSQRDPWGSLDAQVQPHAGRTWWGLLPTGSIAAFTLALTEFAAAVGAGPGQQVLVGLAGAGWYASAHVNVPAGLPWHCLPPYASAWQPAERLWPLPNAALGNRPFPAWDALPDVQARRCLPLHTQPKGSRAHTRLPWWPPMAYPSAKHPDLV
jgi:hypothetical protein